MRRFSEKDLEFIHSSPSLRGSPASRATLFLVMKGASEDPVKLETTLFFLHPALTHIRSLRPGDEPLNRLCKVSGVLAQLSHHEYSDWLSSFRELLISSR